MEEGKEVGGGEGSVKNDSTCACILVIGLKLRSADLKARARDDPDISWYLVAKFYVYNVSHHEPINVDVTTHSSSQHHRFLQAGYLVIDVFVVFNTYLHRHLKCLHEFFTLGFLHIFGYTYIFNGRSIVAGHARL